MLNFVPKLIHSPLFSGLTAAEIPELIQCLGGLTKKFAKNEYIFTSGDSVSSLGIILNGRVQIERPDIMGNRILMGEFGMGELFAETFALAQTEHVPVSALAVEPAEIMFVNCRRIIMTCPSSCKFHSQLVSNLVRILATRNVMLNQKITAISQRSLKDKLLTFLGAEAQKHNNRKFSVKFSRQELADYLCADRSAVSRELNRLKAQGIIDFAGNNFKLPDSNLVD